MPGGVVGRHAIRGKDRLVVALVRVNRGGTDAGVCVDACEHERPNVFARKNLIQSRAEKRAVAFLDDDVVFGFAFELRENLTAGSVLYRDADLVSPHHEERVGQVRLEFLAHPNDRLPESAEFSGEVVDARNEARSLSLKRRLPIEEVD